jgi:collagenase-like PrtC family protease
MFDDPYGYIKYCKICDTVLNKEAITNEWICKNCNNENIKGEELMQDNEEIYMLNELNLKRIEAASDLLESISVWLWKIQGLQPEPMWVDQFKSVCNLFEQQLPEE